MKKILLFIMLGSVTKVYGQAFSMTDTLKSWTFYSSTEAPYKKTTLLNHTDSAIKLQWVRYDVNVPEGWETSVCDSIVCHPKTTDTAFIEIPSGKTDNIYGHFYPNKVEGKGWYRVKVFLVSDPSQEYTIKFEGTTKGYTGVADIGNTEPFWSYDQATNYLTITTSEHSTQAAIYDITGKEVIAKTLLPAGEHIDCSALPKGLYLLSLETDQSVTVRKFMK